MVEKHVINAQAHNTRIDRWFSNEIKHLPNSLLQRLFRLKKIKVNRKKIKSSYRLKTGDVVEIFNIHDYKKTNFKKKINYISSSKESKNINELVIHENEDFVVINKPRGIAVQSGTKNLKNIIDVLKYSKSFNDTKPYIVHRIDKETTGIFLVAKNKSSAQFFTSLFRLRKIHKSYIAIVKGEVNDSLKKMVDHLEYFEKNKKIKLKAITSVKIIKKNTHYSLLELNPITGRKHQLRKQLYNRGHPVIGDQKYYINKNNNHKKISMMLHAHKIKFIKNNEKFTYQAKFDKEFTKRLNSCFR